MSSRKREKNNRNEVRKPKTQREIASILGISRSYVSRIEKRALKKLLKELNCGES